MSYHAIENLVEDLIGLLEKSNLPEAKQRHFVYNLYQFQMRFDTSYTELRQFKYLQQIHYLKKLPIAQHPDYKANRTYFEGLEEQDWIDIPDAETESSLAYTENGYFFPSYGSLLWERLKKEGAWPEATEAPEQVTIPNLLADMLDLAEAQGEKALMHNIYLAFLNGVLAYDFDAEAGVPKQFNDWISDADLNRIREHFIKHELLKIKKKGTEFEVPSRLNEISEGTALDRVAQVDFLMSPKKTVEQIAAAFQKEQQQLAELPKKIELIRSKLPSAIEAQQWQFLADNKPEDGHTIVWLFYRDVNVEAVAMRLFLELTFYVDISSIAVKQYVQHPLLLEWQQQEKSLNIADVPLSINVFEFIDADSVEKKLNFLGLWVLPLKAKEVTIAKSIDQLLGYISEVGDQYPKKIHQEFPDAFFAKPYKAYVSIFDADGPIEDFLLFNNLYSISLLFIYHYVQQNKLDAAMKVHKKLESRLTDRFRENIEWYKKDYMPYIKAIQQGKKPALPTLFYKN